MSKPSSSTSARLIRGLLLRRLQYNNHHLPQPNRSFSSCTSTIPNVPSYSAIRNFSSSSSSSSKTNTSLISQFQHSKPKPSFSNTFTFKPPHNPPNLSFTSTGFRFFSSLNNASFAKKVFDKPATALSSAFSRYRQAIGLQFEAFFKRNSLFFFGATGVLLCALLWRIMFGIANTFVGLSEGMAKYGFLALSSAIVAFAVSSFFFTSFFLLNLKSIFIHCRPAWDPLALCLCFKPTSSFLSYFCFFILSLSLSALIHFVMYNLTNSSLTSHTTY